MFLSDKYKEQGKKIGNTLLTILLAGIAAGWLSDTFNFFKFRSNNQFNREQIYVERVEKALEECSSSQEMFASKVDSLSYKIRELEKNQTLISVIEPTSGIPTWFTSVDSRIVSINTSYYTKFLALKGIKMSEYIGRTHEENFGTTIGNIYRKGDQLALKSESPVVRLEIAVNELGEVERGISIKERKKVGPMTVGIKGEWISIERLIPQIKKLKD